MTPCFFLLPLEFSVYLLDFNYDIFWCVSLGSSCLRLCAFCSWISVSFFHFRKFSVILVVVQLLRHVWLCDSWTAAHQSSLSLSISQSFLWGIHVFESVMLSNHLISATPFSFCLTLSQHHGFFPVSQLFASGGQGIGTSASASVLPMSIQGWFLRIHWFDLLVFQGTLKNLLQSHSLKAWILWHWVFSMTGKTALNKQTFVGKWCLCYLICCVGLS